MASVVSEVFFCYIFIWIWRKKHSLITILHFLGANWLQQIIFFRPNVSPFSVRYIAVYSAEHLWLLEFFKIRSHFDFYIFSYLWFFFRLICCFSRERDIISLSLSLSLSIYLSFYLSIYLSQRTFLLLWMLGFYTSKVFMLFMLNCSHTLKLCIWLIFLYT